jgi:lysophospholipase L1-like esterase
MKTIFLFLFATSLLGGLPFRGIAAEKEPPDVAAIRLDKEGKPMKVFFDRHEEFLQRGRQGPIGVLFLGDSITAGWAMAPEIWKKNFGAYQPANFGIGGDRTQNVLWRIENGELDGLSPSVVVVLIGVNNGTDPRVTAGIRKVVAAIQDKLPKTKILLLGIFPYGKTLTQYPWTQKTRDHVAAVNKELAALDDGGRVRFLDFGARYLLPDGSISPEVMPDGLHPARPGYQIWADEMKPLLDEMMKAP